LKINSSNSTLGAFIYDVDLRKLLEDDLLVNDMLEAWHKFAVLVFPGQRLNDETHIAFSRIFGDLEKLLTSSIADMNPEICRVSNVRLDGSMDAPGGTYELHQRGNQYWHTDSSFKKIASKASVLRAHTIPKTGGETEFADMRAAYDELTPKQKVFFEDKVVVHDFIYSQGLIGGLEQLTDQELNGLPPARHRLIQIHPETHRRSLFVGRHASHIEGEDIETSRSELIQLTKKACQPPRIFKHSWKEGDVVVWDNRCVLHRGHPWPQNEARIMYRTTVAGDGEDNSWKLKNNTISAN
tara:strand:+ start:1114 stop:2004 length:891 start_codon:yes stop_codon:yes gene_type:complete